MDFGSGEPLDDPHRSTTFRAGVKVAGVFGGGSVFFVRRLSSAGQKAEVPDTHKARRKQVQEKAAQELTDR